MEGKDTFGLALFGQQALETLVHDDLLALRTDLFEACVVLCEREARILHREKGGETRGKIFFFSSSCQTDYFLCPSPAGAPAVDANDPQ